MKKSGVMLVGLCGRSGSGKGYVSALFLNEGIPAIDTDAVYRQMTAPADTLSECMIELVKRFGEIILSEDNSLNRAVLRDIVFGEDKTALSDLNEITHKYILKRTEEIADEYFREGYNIVLVDAPVLYESGFDKKCECVVCVCAPEEVVVSRIMKRDGVTREAAEKRLSSQVSVQELISRTDFAIMNDCEKDVLIGRVKDCASKLQEIYSRNYK